VSDAELEGTAQDVALRVKVFALIAKVVPQA
jgi:hypothetical protein